MKLIVANSDSAHL